MAIGKKNRGDLVAYSFKIKTKDLPSPVFEIQKRVGEKYEPAGTTDTVSGNLIGAEPKTFEWNGPTGKQIIKSVTLTLQDKSDIYFVTVPETSVGRGLLNSALSLPAFNDVEIGLYQSKPREGQTKTFPQTSLRQAGEIVRWKYDLKDLPAPEEIIFKGQKMRDFSKQWDFLTAQITELNKLIKSKTPVHANESVAPQQEVASSVETNSEVPAAPEETGEPIPF